MKINGKIAAVALFASVFGVLFMVSKPAHAACPPCSAPGQTECMMPDGTTVPENAQCANEAPAEPSTEPSITPSAAPSSNPVAPSTDPGNNGGGNNGGNNGGGNAGGTNSCPAGTSAKECAKKGLGEVTNPDDETDLTKIISTILNTVFFVLGIVAVIIIILGGFSYMTSQGDSSKVEKGKKTILYGVIGLIICLIASAIVNFVIKSLD